MDELVLVFRLNLRMRRNNYDAYMQSTNLEEEICFY